MAHLERGWREGLDMLTRAAVAIAALMGGLLLIPSSPAHASACPNPRPGPGGITICASDPGDGGNDGSPGNGSSGGGTGDSGCTYQGKSIPCSTGFGTWNAAHSCYIMLADPQPDPANDPGGVWAAVGGDPAKGRIYSCYPPGWVGTPNYIFIADGQGTPPDPAEMAKKALGELPLVKPTVNTAPKPPDRTYVGLRTWLWMDSGQWAPLTKSVTAGSTTVTVKAVPDHVTWDMGEGSTTCASGGKAWPFGTTDNSLSTDCGYTYEHTGTYHVSAQLTYTATWTCSGTCTSDSGDLGSVTGAAGGSSLTVDERQSVNINP